MITETQAANVMWGKTARACDACMSRRARRYCAADEAFLCQICDASVHSANQLASRHERIRLRSSSSSTRLPRIEKADQKFEISGEGEEEREPAWCGGFIRKARTPRGTYANKQEKDGNNLFLMDFNSSNSLVPEIGVEEGLFSPADENEANLNCQVPVFDPFPDMDTVKNEPFSNNDYAEFIPYESAIDEKEQDDDLQGLIPMDLDLAEFALDVESLLGDDSCLGVKDGSPDLEQSKEMPIKIVKDEEPEVKDGEILGLKFGFGSRPMDEEDKLDNIMRNRTLVNGKKNNTRLLRLDYEAVITAWHSQGSPWTTGSRPEVLPDDCWPGCLFEGYMCPKHEETVAVRSVSDVVRRNGGIGGEREARVSRYREKRRTRLFAKKIRYEVRKLNAEKRPRIKGRFVKRTSLFL